MAAVQFDRSGGSVAPAPSRRRSSTTADVGGRRGRRLRLADARTDSRACRAYDDADDATAPTREPEDHWTDGARAQLAMVGVAFGL